MEFRTSTVLKIYTGEDVVLEGRPLYKTILAKAYELGLAGATVTKGIAGYATQKRGLGRAVNKLFSGMENMPVIIEIVDSRENLEKLLPYLEKNAKHCFITIKDCTYLVTDYLRNEVL